MAFLPGTSVNPQALVPVLPKLIQHPAAEVRATAIEVFAQFDKKEALKLVREMVFDPDPMKRELGIFHAGRLDFPSVRELLLKALQSETHPDNFEQVCAILAANGNEDLFVNLMRWRQTQEGTRGQMIDGLLHQCGQRLIREKKVPYPGYDEFRKAIALRLESEREKAAGDGRAAETETLAALEEELKTGRFPNLPITHQAGLLGTITDKDSFRKIRDQVRSLKLDTLHRATLLELVNRMGSFGSKSEADHLFPLIHHSDPSSSARPSKRSAPSISTF